MSFPGEKKMAEFIIKDNATTFTEAETMLFGTRCEELVFYSLILKNKVKKLFDSIKNQDHPRREIEGCPFGKAFYLEPEEIEVREYSQLLVKPYNNNTLQEEKQRVRLNLLEIPSICSTDLLSPSEF